VFAIGTVQPGPTISTPGAHGRRPYQPTELRRVGADLGPWSVQLAAQLRRAPVVPTVEGSQFVLPWRWAQRRQRQDLELDVRRDGQVDLVRLYTAGESTCLVTSPRGVVWWWRSVTVWRWRRKKSTRYDVVDSRRLRGLELAVVGIKRRKSSDWVMYGMLTTA